MAASSLTARELRESEQAMAAHVARREVEIADLHLLQLMVSGRRPPPWSPLNR